MAKDRRIYGEISSKQDMKTVFTNIPGDVDHARTRPALTELYKRAGYLITLTHAPAWRQKFGARLAGLREVGEEEFRKTARKINQRALAIGAGADFDDKWGS